MQTVRKEGVKGLYKGATPPLFGWMVMDSVYVPGLLHENAYDMPSPGNALIGKK